MSHKRKKAATLQISTTLSTGPPLLRGSILLEEMWFGVVAHPVLCCHCWYSFKEGSAIREGKAGYSWHQGRAAESTMHLSCHVSLSCSHSGPAPSVGASLCSCWIHSKSKSGQSHPHVPPSFSIEDCRTLKSSRQLLCDGIRVNRSQLCPVFTCCLSSTVNTLVVALSQWTH